MFRFANIEVLWWLAGIPVLLLLMVYSRSRRRRRVQAYADATMARRLMPFASRSRFWVRSSLFLLGLAFLIFGLARPQFGLKQVKTKREGIEIMMVLDVSRSMEARDIKPSRLARAKLEIERLLEKMQQDRIGLILFAGSAYVQLPITNDFVAAKTFLSSVNTDMISEQGTALGNALELAMKSFSPQENVGKAIIVISDGENHEDDPISVAKQAKELGIPVYTVGIGSPSGSPIPDGRGGVKKDMDGNVVVSKLDEATLIKVAAEGGGVYLRAMNSNMGLSPIMRELDRLQKAEFEDISYASYNEQYQIFLFLSLFCFILGSLILERRNPWFSVDRLYKEMRKV